MWSVLRYYDQDSWSHEYISVKEAEKIWRYSSVVGYTPDSNDVSTEAEESPLLGAVTK
jgi:hypothetical protein